MMKKILITGAAGFIGQHLSQELAGRKEYKIILFDIQKKNYNVDGKFIRGDVNNQKQVIDVCSGVDGIIHLAATSRVSLAQQFPHRCIDVNVMGAVNILEGVRLSRRKPWLILGSSREVNFDWQDKRLNSDFRKINNFYGISKFMAEFLCFKYSKEYNLRTLILRFSDVYGSHYDNQEKILPKLISGTINNSQIIIANPTQQFDFIHYKDIIRGIYLAAKYMHRSKPSFFKEIVLSTGRLITLNELAKFIVRETRSSSKLKYDVSVLGKFSGGIFTDNKGAERMLNFKANISVEEGIRYMIKSFKNKDRK